MPYSLSCRNALLPVTFTCGAINWSSFLPSVFCLFRHISCTWRRSWCLCSYGSDNQQGANWHPTRAFHMLRGEAIAWIFGLVMLETVREVQEALEQGKSEDALRKGKFVRVCDCCCVYPYVVAGSSVPLLFDQHGSEMARVPTLVLVLVVVLLSLYWYF